MRSEEGQWRTVSASRGPAMICVGENRFKRNRPLPQDIHGRCRSSTAWSSGNTTNRLRKRIARLPKTAVARNWGIWGHGVESPRLAVRAQAFPSSLRHVAFGLDFAAKSCQTPAPIRRIRLQVCSHWTGLRAGHQTSPSPTPTVGNGAVSALGIGAALVPRRNTFGPSTRKLHFEVSYRLLPVRDRTRPRGRAGPGRARLRPSRIDASESPFSRAFGAAAVEVELLVDCHG